MIIRNLCLALVCVGCSQEQQIFRDRTREVFYQEPSDDVDILWVVDNSQSMADIQAKVGEGFSDFIEGLEEVGVDFHIGVVTTDMDHYEQAGMLQGVPQIITPDTEDFGAVFAERVQVGTDGSNMEKGIDTAYKALTSPMIFEANAGFRRKGAALMINYVSDEDDCTDRGGLWGVDARRPCYERSDLLTPTADLISEYKGLKEGRDRMIVSAIVGPSMSESHPDCGTWRPGERYTTMAKAFGGIQGNICEQDFAFMMSDLGMQVSGLLTSFILDHFAVQETIEVYVDQDQIPEGEDDGWTYDGEYHVVYFHGAGVPPRGSTITIDYEIAAPG